MPRSRNAETKSSREDMPTRMPTLGESAQYIHDMLISLKKIAALHKQTQLMRLLQAAAEEARVIGEKESA